MTEPKPTKWGQVIVKLTNLTQEGKLTWDVQPPLGSVDERRHTRNNASFRTRYKDWILRLSEYQARYDPVGAGMYAGPEGVIMVEPSGSLSLRPKVAFGESMWRIEHRLEIIDEGGETIWTIPERAGLAALYSAVQYRAARAGDFL